MRIGLDLGGTNLAAGLVDEEYRIVARESVPADAARGARAVLGDMVALVKALRAQGEATSIGIGVPGLADKAAGRITYTCNLPLGNTPAVEILRRETGLPVLLENDANAAALGEMLAGAGRGCGNFLMLTLGTGIGGGIIVNGKIYEGKNGSAGEIGHMVIVAGGLPCSCGRQGCFEKYASARGLVALTEKAMAENPQSLLHQCISDGHVSGRTAFVAARQNDPAALAVVEQYIEYLACGVTNLVNLFDPELVLVGGGVANEGEALLAPLREIVSREKYPPGGVPVRIEKAALGNDAGIIGAAYL